MLYLPFRKSPVHCEPYSRKGQAIIIFVTVVTRDCPSIANDLFLSTITTTWRQYTSWYVGHFVIMPDHIHLFAAPSADGSHSLKNWIRAWKSVVSRQLNGTGCAVRWQRNFWDTQIRNSDHMADRIEYVRQNPVKAGLCDHEDKWRYGGKIFDINDWWDFNC